MIGMCIPLSAMTWYLGTAAPSASPGFYGMDSLSAGSGQVFLNHDRLGSGHHAFHQII
jgi:hypothetical protein